MPEGKYFCIRKMNRRRSGTGWCSRAGLTGSRSNNPVGLFEPAGIFYVLQARGTNVLNQ